MDHSPFLPYFQNAIPFLPKIVWLKIYKIIVWRKINIPAVWISQSVIQILYWNPKILLFSGWETLKKTDLMVVDNRQADIDRLW